MFPPGEGRSGAQSLVEVGVVVKPHGVRGEVKVRLHRPGSRALDEARRVTLLAGEERREVRVHPAGRSGADGVCLGVEGVSDRDGAEALRGARILVEREPVVDGEYYYVDLIGCEVVDEEGRPRGTVHDVFEAGASDILAVREGRLERYVPFVEGWVGGVDLRARRVQVRRIDELEAWTVDEE